MSHQVRETVYCHFYIIFTPIIKKQILPGKLALSIIRSTIASDQRRLNGRREHDRRLIAIFFQRLQQLAGKPEIPCHELFLVLRTVDPCQMKDELCLLTVLLQLLQGGIQIIFIDLIDHDPRTGTILILFDIIKVRYEGGADHALRAGY